MGSIDVCCILFLITILAVAFNVLAVEANPDVIIVPDKYFSIQEAINNSKSGDTIFVKSGIYFENVVVNKNGLRLVGEDRYTTIIDGRGTGIVTCVEANNTELSNFTMQNSGSSLTDSGIYLNYSFNNSIFNNKVNSNHLGIYLSSSPNCILRDNNMNENQYNFGVSGNNLQDYIHDIDTSNIVDGKSIIYWVNQTNKLPPSDAGYVAIVNSTKITVEDVTVTKNWQAVLFAYTTNSTIKNVAVTSNMDAIWLIECTDCSVYDNTVSENNWGGIALVNSYLCSVQGNDIIRNKEYGIFLSYSSDNIFYHNNFDNNKRQAWLYGVNNNNSWDAGNLIGGNYWSDYNGTDEKSGPNQNEDGPDKIGDTPYIIFPDNKDDYPLMQPLIITPPEATQATVWLYVIMGIGIIVIVLFTVTHLLKHRQRIAVTGKIRRSAA
jgi:parallel beta-helix repeat protein